MASSPLNPPLRLFRSWPLQKDRRRVGRSAAAPSRTQPSLTELVEQAIAAVNARGLCAAEVARIADLPSAEIASMAAQCGCSGCWGARAN